MTPVFLTIAGIALTLVSFFALGWWVIGYFTRDTGTHAAPRREQDDWDEPAPGEWLPAPPAPEVAHDEDWRASLTEWWEVLNERQAALEQREAALEERQHSGVIVASVYHPTPPGPPGDYEWREPFAWWLSDTNVGGMLAITDGRS